MKSIGSRPHKIRAMKANTRPFRQVFSMNHASERKMEQLNQQDDKSSRNQFLSNFDWTDSTLEREVKQAVETLLVEPHDIFTRTGFEIRINTEIKVQLTPVYNRPAYSQNLPAPITSKMIFL